MPEAATACCTLEEERLGARAAGVVAAPEEVGARRSAVAHWGSGQAAGARPALEPGRTASVSAAALAPHEAAVRASPREEESQRCTGGSHRPDRPGSRHPCHTAGTRGEGSCIAPPSRSAEPCILRWSCRRRALRQDGARPPPHRPVSTKHAPFQFSAMPCLTSLEPSRETDTRSSQVLPDHRGGRHPQPRTTRSDT
jgi:hypothetical protein